ncbi:MAG: threonylcarbamoyl-AMP synthase [Spirochaetaceae bacterium]|nr:threonylcarbamoyl-AMP synthase [Spirochaetaceae bacterium]
MIVKIDDPNSHLLCVKALKEKKIVIIPTDTIYGFSGIVPDTEESILQIKKRCIEKKMIRLIAEPSDVSLYTDQKIPDVFLKKWPGALTLIVKSKEDGESVAIRCPAFEWLRTIIKEVGKPIFSTSVNISGKKYFTSIKEISKAFDKKVSLIIDAGELNTLPSTVLDLTYDQPLILRRGSVSV